MDLVLCHRTADFDTLGAAVGITRLQPGSRIVLSSGAHPGVRDFLALYRDEYPLIERRSVNANQIRSITVVDTQRRELLDKAGAWLDLPGVEITVYDHHLDHASDIPATRLQIEPVGATTTLIVEQLQQQHLTLTEAEATVMALGIHVDTGSLTYDRTTVRDAAALTWLMAQGANQRAIGEYTEPGLSAELQALLTLALDQLQTKTVQGCRLSWVLLDTEGYTPGLSSLASHLLALTESDTLLLGNFYSLRGEGRERLTVIGRTQIQGVDLNALFQPLGGGGHPRAAAVTLRTTEPAMLLEQLQTDLEAQLPQPPTARELMSSPVRTIRPDTTVNQARRLLLRYGHSGLCVADEQGQLVGMISRRDLDIALHHGFGHAPVKGYMSAPVRTIAPDTLLPEIESLMVTYDIGRLPVVEAEQLVGIVTRTDVLRQLYQLNQSSPQQHPQLSRASLRDRLQTCLPPELQQIMTDAAAEASKRDWQLYLVGGAVRDLLLTADYDTVGVLSEISIAAASCLPIYTFRELDLVVDGVKNVTEAGAGVELARSLQQQHPEVQLQVYGQFQTAALHWGSGSPLQGFAVDIATARSEFYPYPAAHPEVTASSIRQDLYRRDFTINALAVRLTSPRAGELLDFFGGLVDLQQRQIRVLHPNSFIEDPTRIFRAVRFAVRLGFHLEPQTETYIRHGIASGAYERTQEQNSKAPSLQSRLKNELKYLLQPGNQSPQSQAFPGEAALKLLATLGALACIHPDLHADTYLWGQLRLSWIWLCRFDPQFIQIKPWELLLEVLLSHLEPSSRRQAAANLHLPEPAQERLSHFNHRLDFITDRLQHKLSPSQTTQLLDAYDLPSFILLAPHVSPSVRRSLWRYLEDWSKVKPPLNGKDLQNLGYKPGKQFRQILDELRWATLDGQIHDRPQAENYLRRYYPI